MMAAYMLSAKPRPEQADGPVMRRYLHAVRACLRHPWRTCIASAVFFGYSLLLASMLPSTFMDVGAEALSLATLDAPPGSTLKDPLALHDGAYQTLRDMPALLPIYILYVNRRIAGSKFTRVRTGRE